MPSHNRVNSYMPSTMTGTLFHESIISVKIQNITKYIYPVRAEKWYSHLTNTYVYILMNSTEI